MVEVGEASVGDDDVRQRVRGLLDLLQHVLCDVSEEQLQDPDGVPSVGDRSKHPLPLPGLAHLDELLSTQNLVVDTAGQRNLIGTASLLRIRLLAHPQQAAADDVDDVDEQERHIPRAEAAPEIARHDIEGAHRRGILRRGQHLGQSHPITRHVRLPDLRALLPADAAGITPFPYTEAPGDGVTSGGPSS